MTRNQQALVQGFLGTGIALFLFGVGVLFFVSTGAGAVLAGLGFAALIATFVVSSTLEPAKSAEATKADKRSWRGLWIALAVLFVIVMGGGAIQIFMTS